MKRLLGSSWKHIAIQLGLLGGIAMAFVAGTREDSALADGAPDCPSEDDCSFKKPSIMLLMDYSTSMNAIWDLQNNLTRWQVVLSSIKTVTGENTFLSDNANLALMRFGHDPSVEPGTVIPNDSSGLVDGQKLDVAWYEVEDTWFPCQGEEIGAALDAAGDPIDGSLIGIGTWTKGALDYAALIIDQAVADHPIDAGERVYLNIVVTDGAWTGQDGTTVLAPAEQNPAITAADLYGNDDVATYVVAVAGDPDAELAADSLAAAGGTTAAIDGDTPALLEMALTDLIAQIISDVVAPDCVGGLPRIMVLLDASSSMLNINGGTMAGGMGTTGWDLAREALAGQVDSLFDVEVADLPGFLLEDVAHFGLAVFGHNAPAPGQQRILVDYGPCMQDNFRWALDPETSCELPGCEDPWGGPPIAWTFQDGTLDPPGFNEPTTSAMPSCDGNAPFCAGAGTYTHLGLQLIRDNQISYLANAQMMDAQYPVDLSTEFVNILVTDGQYTGYSTDAQVQSELAQMYAAGITTYVIGLGDGVDTPAAIAQLNSMADWGSGGALDYYDANDQAELELALAEIVGAAMFNPCCAFNDCSSNPNPTDDGGWDEGEGPEDGFPDDGDTSAGETTISDDGSTSEGETSETDSESESTTSDDETSAAETDGESESDGEGTGSDGGSADDITEWDEGCSCSAPSSSAGQLSSLLLLALAGVRRCRTRVG